MQQQDSHATPRNDQEAAVIRDAMMLYSALSDEGRAKLLGQLTEALDKCRTKKA